MITTPTESISVKHSTERFRVLAALNELHLKYKSLGDGAVADYIPELARANPDWFGICVVTADGQVYEVGDYDQPFTIQSISKPFVYGMALEDHGREAILGRVGVEPTGDAFNSIIQLDENNRPHNPCVNAGAIAINSMIKGDDPTHKLNRLRAMFNRFAGRELAVDMSVYTSERTTGHRNRAITHLMLQFDMIHERVEEVLDLYFQQCSVLLTARDLAVMAATFANQGVNPITGERALEQQYVRDVLTVMYTCGMYEFAGEWAYAVGLPAKSGVCGGIMAVLPNQLGIAVYSPKLDSHGNSVRAIKVCEDLSQNFGMHLFGQNSSHDSLMGQDRAAMYGGAGIEMTNVARELLATPSSPTA